MEEAVTCPVCSDLYRQGPKEPLVLPCGHTFCRTCLNTMYTTTTTTNTTTTPTCPNCRRDLGDIHSLPVCYPLLSLAAQYSEFRYDICQCHGEEQRFWCEECQRSLCSLCLYSDHPPGHQVLPAREALESRRKGLREDMATIKGWLRARRVEVRLISMELSEKLQQVCNLEHQMEQLSAAVHTACCLDDVVACEDKAKGIKEKQAKDDLRSVENFDNLDNSAVLKIIESAECKHKEQLKHQQQRISMSDEQQENTGDGSHSLSACLDSQEGRLLMSCIAHPVNTNLSQQLPSEVYLDLSGGGVHLGRVYIRLWCHLRRAQQFLALCLGTLGPSYLNASFSHVAYMKQAKETLCCKEYREKRNSISGTKELISDLEWGGEFSGEPRKGLLIPLSKNTNEHGFGICTRSQPGGTFHCPFGEVTSGMGVVVAAVRHNPVTEVTITQCGVVLPELSL